MERSGHTPPVGVRSDDLTELLTVSDRGPFVTLWLAGDETLETGQNHVGLRWQSQRRELSNAGVAEDLLDRLENAVNELGNDVKGAVIVADQQDVRLVERLSAPPRQELCRLEALPSLAPVIEHRQGQVPFVIVLTDRTGADLIAAGGDGGDDEHVHVDGAEGPIRKIQPGGWSQRRFQQRAENTWEQTAGEVADALTTLVDQIDPAVVLVGGDVRATQLLRDRVAVTIKDRVREIPGGRAADGSEGERDAAIRRWVRTAIAEHTVELLQTFQRERGQGDRAADGPQATVEALRMSQVDVLCIHDDADDDRRAWFSDDDPLLVALERDDLAGLVDGSPREGRLVDVAIRAALASGAAVRIVPAASPITDAVGAILRWGAQSGLVAQP